MTTLVFTMSGAQSLAEEMADDLGLQLGHIKVHEFPDGETLFRIMDPVAGKHVCLVARLDKPDDKTLQILILADGLRQQDAASVTLVAPYLPYMRQDIAFNSGEVVSARAFAKLISQSFDRVVTVDPHLHRYAALDEVYTIPAQTVSAAAPMAHWIGQQTSAPLIIGPDIESEQWVSKVSSALDAPFYTLRKVRKGDHDVEISLSELNVDTDGTLVLVDDIISSGATMLRTIEQLHVAFPDREIICCAVHCLASAETLDQFSAMGVRAMAATDSVQSKISTIKISGMLSAALAKELEA